MDYILVFIKKSKKEKAKRDIIFKNSVQQNSIISIIECLGYLHAQACFGSSKWQHFDFYSLPFAHNIGNIGNPSFSSKLWDVDQALPTLPVNETEGHEILYIITPTVLRIIQSLD